MDLGGFCGFGRMREWADMDVGEETRKARSGSACTCNEEQAGEPLFWRVFAVIIGFELFASMCLLRCLLA